MDQPKRAAQVSVQRTLLDAAWMVIQKKSSSMSGTAMMRFHCLPWRLQLPV